MTEQGQQRIYWVWKHLLMKHRLMMRPHEAPLSDRVPACLPACLPGEAVWTAMRLRAAQPMSKYGE